MAVKPFFDFSIDYDGGGGSGARGTVLAQPRSATAEEKAARKAADYIAGAAGRAERAAKTAAQQAEKARQQRASKQASEPPARDKSKRHGKTIIWDGESECFEDLRYSASAGGVFATFIKGGGQYFYPMSRADAQEWLVDYADVTGELFNADIR